MSVFWKAIFYLGVTVVGLGGLGICMLAIPYDPFVSYTVVNNTGEELLTWVMERDCSVVVGNKSDYLKTVVVPPHQTIEYRSFSEHAKCIQVVTSDRHLVLARDYDYRAVVVISEPITASTVIPQESDLPSAPGPSLIETLLTKPGRRLLVAYASVFLIVSGGLPALKASRVLRRKGVIV